MTTAALHPDLPTVVREPMPQATSDVTYVSPESHVGGGHWVACGRGCGWKETGTACSWSRLVRREKVLEARQNLGKSRSE